MRFLGTNISICTVVVMVFLPFFRVDLYWNLILLLLLLLSSYYPQERGIGEQRRKIKKGNKRNCA